MNIRVATVCNSTDTVCGRVQGRPEPLSPAMALTAGPRCSMELQKHHQAAMSSRDNSCKCSEGAARQVGRPAADSLWCSFPEACIWCGGQDHEDDGPRSLVCCSSCFGQATHGQYAWKGRGHPSRPPPAVSERAACAQSLSVVHAVLCPCLPPRFTAVYRPTTVPPART